MRVDCVMSRGLADVPMFLVEIRAHLRRGGEVAGVGVGEEVRE